MNDNILFVTIFISVMTFIANFLFNSVRKSDQKRREIEQKFFKLEESYREEINDVSRFCEDKIDYMKSQARDVYGVRKMQNPPLPPPKKDKKFKKQELVNLELKDSITGDLLDTVKCKCGSYYSRDTYAVHGCPNCKKPIINEK